MTQHAPAQPELLLIGTGGTISAVGANALDFHDYPMLGQRLSAHALLEAVPEAAQARDIHVSAFEPVSSTQLGPSFWWQLLAEIADARRRYPALAGIVVTHGTGTLEETAFVADLFAGTDIPIVFTGAQRPINGLSSDAAFNLWSAMLVAADPAARQRGALVVMNGEIHAASEVTKATNFTLDAFQSHPAGPLGAIEGTSAVFRRVRERPTPTLVWPEGAVWPRVEIVMSYAGADGAQIDAAIAAGAKGLVIAGLAPGYATPDQRRALKEARAAGCEIVISSRALVGPTLSLAQNGVDGLIGSRCLPPSKARILLAGALMSSAGTAEIDSLFQAFA